MSFKKKPRVYEILRTPEVWEKVILCTSDFSSCRSSFFADDIRVIPPLVSINYANCKNLRCYLCIFYVCVRARPASLAEIYFLEKKDNNILLKLMLCNCSRHYRLIVAISRIVLFRVHSHKRDTPCLFDTSGGIKCWKKSSFQ